MHNLSTDGRMFEQNIYQNNSVHSNQSAHSTQDSRQTASIANAPSTPQKGQLISGEIIDLSGKNVKIMLDDGRVLSARLADKLDLSIGQRASFSVTDASTGQILLKLINDSNPDMANPAILRALEGAGLSDTARNREAVQALLDNGMSVDKNSLHRLLASQAGFRNASFATLAQMTKAGIPLTEINTAQYEAYKDSEHLLLAQFDKALDALETVVSGGALFEDVGGVLAGVLGENTGGALGEHNVGVPEEALGVYDKASFSALRDVVRDFVMLRPEDLSKESISAHIDKLDGLVGRLEDLIKDGVALSLNDQEVILSGMTSTEEIGKMLSGMSGADEAAGFASGQLSDEAVAGVLTGELSLEEAAGGLEDKLSLEETPGALSGRLSTTEMAREIVGILSPPEAAKVLAGKLSPPEVAKALAGKLSPAEEENLLLGRFKLSETAKALSERLDSEELSKLLVKKLSSEELKMLISEKLSQKADTLVKQRDAEPLKAAVSDLRSNIDFVKNLNQVFSYVQVPMKMKAGGSEGELFVYAKRRKPQPGDSVSVLLHLNMDSLGELNVHMALQGKNLNANFMSSDAQARELLAGEMDSLNEILEKQGFIVSTRVTGDEAEKSPLERLVIGEESGEYKRYSFDIRA